MNTTESGDTINERKHIQRLLRFVFHKFCPFLVGWPSILSSVRPHWLKRSSSTIHSDANDRTILLTTALLGWASILIPLDRPLLIRIFQVWLAAKSVLHFQQTFKTIILEYLSHPSSETYFPSPKGAILPSLESSIINYKARSNNKLQREKLTKITDQVFHWNVET